MKLVLTRRAITDLERLHAFNAEKNPAAAARINDEVIDALESLLEFPLRYPAVDPEVSPQVRRMAIDTGMGYVAVFRVILNAAGEPAAVRILAIRSAREAGF